MLAACLLAACGGGSTTAEATATPVEPTASIAPYLRLVYVDGSAATASDTGPGSATEPYRSLSAAMKNLRPGDDVIVGAGTYREAIVVPALNWGTAQTRLRAKTARGVLVKGSVEASGFAAVSGGVYSVAWGGEEPEQVFRDGTALQQISGTVFGGYPSNPPADLAGAHASEGGIWLGRVAGNASTLPPDSFFYDAAARKLFVRLSTPLSASQTLEVSALRHVLQAENASNLSIDGLDFAHANTSFTYRQGAVKVQGDHNLLNNLVVRDMDAACVQLIGNDTTLSNSTIVRCGQVGISGRGARLTISGNQVTHNNTRTFNRWWEAGGIKLVGPGGLSSSTLRSNVVAYNYGHGIWVDSLATQNLIDSNITAYNAGFGIHYEASASATIRGNQSYGNDLRGIYLLESSASTISGNAVFGNGLEGIAVTDGTRSGTDAALRPLGNQVTGNTSAWNDTNASNWVQLVLPGQGYGSVSDKNSFKADWVGPRFAMGFVSNTNPAFEYIQTWRSNTQQDATSTAQLLDMPSALKAALAAKRLLVASELPSYLANPGSY